MPLAFHPCHMRDNVTLTSLVSIGDGFLFPLWTTNLFGIIWYKKSLKMCVCQCMCLCANLCVCVCVYLCNATYVELLVYQELSNLYNNITKCWKAISYVLQKNSRVIREKSLYFFEHKTDKLVIEIKTRLIALL